jgi:hypothetical protein
MRQCMSLHFRSRTRSVFYVCKFPAAIEADSCHEALRSGTMSAKRGALDEFVFASCLKAAGLQIIS